MKIIRNLFTDVASVDLRALSACRIFLSATILYDLLFRFSYVSYFYSDDSLLSRKDHSVLGVEWAFSLFYISGSEKFSYFLLSLGVLAALSLLLGYKAKLSGWILWLVLISSYSRAPVISHLGNAVAFSLLFWLNFLPMDRKWSIQKHRTEAFSLSDGYVASGASIAVLLQVLSIYFFTALLKSHPVWNRDFTAMFFALHMDAYSTEIGKFLLAEEGITRALTAIIYYLELLGPVALVSPGLQKLVRYPLALVFLVFHFGLFLTLNIGAFPFYCISAWILFLPKKFWDFFGSNDVYLLYRESIYKKFAVVPLILSVLYLNFAGIAKFKLPVSDWLSYPIRLIRMEQSWRMYAPSPPLQDGWFIFVAKMQDGTSRDAWKGGPEPVFKKPSHLYSYYGSDFWRQFFEAAFGVTKNRHAKKFAIYLCDVWNKERKFGTSEKVVSIQIFHQVEASPPEGAQNLKPILRAEADCSK